jgi:hypothetical protein
MLNMFPKVAGWARPKLRSGWNKIKIHTCPGEPAGAVGRLLADPKPSRPPETAVADLFASLTPRQREEVCFDWDFMHPDLGHLRTFVCNHWQVTRPAIRSSFYTKHQQWLIHDIFKGLVNPDWYLRFQKQNSDDTMGHRWGTNQSIAIFGSPEDGKLEFLITGRHLTLRADGNLDDGMAFGGPIFYGHAAGGFVEKAGHPGNVFWPQGRRASAVFAMLEKEQRAKAVVDRGPDEPGTAFLGDTVAPTGIPVAAMNQEQKDELARVVDGLVEPFSEKARRRVHACLVSAGGLDSCTLTFYREGRPDDEREWNHWKLTGPAFAWYFRGTPHVHVWARVASDPAVSFYGRPGLFLHPEHDPLSY